MLKITRSIEPIEVKNLCLLVYGSPGLGKSSMAFTAEAPLLLDFDRGAHRTFSRGDSVQVDRWEEISKMSADDVAEYKTIVVDTVGRLLDALAVSIIEGNPKMKGYGGALSLQGYGALKAAYSGWLKTLISYGKDIVLIAHDKEEKNGDDIIVRPDIQGGSYSEVFKRADGMAYLHKVGKDTILDFSPTDQWVGKNAAGFEPLKVPNFSTAPAYFSDIISSIKKKLNRMSEDQIATMKEVDDWRDKIESTQTAEDINGLLPDIKKLQNPVLAQVKTILAGQAQKLQLVGDKKTGVYSVQP